MYLHHPFDFDGSFDDINYFLLIIPYLLTYFSFFLSLQLAAAGGTGQFAVSIPAGNIFVWQCVDIQLNNLLYHFVNHTM